MRNFARVNLQVFVLSVLLVQTSLSGNAQKPITITHAEDLQFASRQNARIPFELVGNFVFLRARANDSKPLWFLLDTGATASYLDVRQATALGLNQDDSAEDSVGCLYRKKLQLRPEPTSDRERVRF